MSPPQVPPRITARPIAEIAREVRVDPRVAALVPGFDAPFFQAGLAGYSDGAMRIIARRHGCPFCVTEALLDQTLINGGKGRTREDPDLLAAECGTGAIEDNVPARLASAALSSASDDDAWPQRGCATPGAARAHGGTLHDHPIAGQIIGTRPEQMAHGAAILVGLGHDVVDVNLACPVKKIRRASRGGHYLAHPAEAIEVLRAVRAAVPERVPCTVKLRRAYDDTPEMARHFERIFDAACELGYAWATVHCRTVEQKYLGPGRWEFLRDLTRRRGDRVIFGSGDVWTVEDIFAMLELTGVQGVSVARGCIGNPWIFRQARALMEGREAALPTLAEQRAALVEHFDLSCALWGEHRAGRMMRKFGIRFAAHHPRAAEVRQAFIRCDTVESWRAVIDRMYPAPRGCDPPPRVEPGTAEASTG